MASEMLDRIEMAIQRVAMVTGPDYRGMAVAALEALREPLPLMVATVAIQTEEATAEDREIGVRAMALLPPTRHVEAPDILAELVRDHRAMIQAALGATGAN